MTNFQLKYEKNTVWIILREIVSKELQPYITYTYIIINKFELTKSYTVIK